MNIKYPIHYSHEDLRKFLDRHKNREYSTFLQRDINKTILKIYNKFKRDASELDIVTDAIVGLYNVDGDEKNLYVIDGKIVCMFYEKTIPMGSETEKGIFFIRNFKEAKKLYNELEKWIVQQDINQFY